MKDFNEFLDYLGGNAAKAAYDASRFGSEELSPPMEALVEELVMVSHKTTISLLRQYHDWLNSQ